MSSENRTQNGRADKKYGNLLRKNVQKGEQTGNSGKGREKKLHRNWKRKRD